MPGKQDIMVNVLMVSLSSIVLLLDVFSGGVDPAQPVVVVAAPKAPPVVQNPAEARPLGRCCTVGHYWGHTTSISNCDIFSNVH